MPACTLATIQSYIDAKHTITAYHEVLGDNPCTHGAELDLAQLAKVFGPDFNIPDRHAEFVGRLRCSACGRKGSMSIRIAPPSREGFHLPHKGRGLVDRHSALQRGTLHLSQVPGGDHQPEVALAQTTQQEGVAGDDARPFGFP